jgi:hypothetical protein
VVEIGRGPISNAAIVISLRIARIELGRLTQIRDGAVEVVPVGIGVATVVVRKRIRSPDGRTENVVNARRLFSLGSLTGQAAKGDLRRVIGNMVNGWGANDNKSCALRPSAKAR